MKKRMYKKAIKWFVANHFCLFDPVPMIKGKHKLALWNKWHNTNRRMAIALQTPKLIV